MCVCVCVYVCVSVSVCVPAGRTQLKERVKGSSQAFPMTATCPFTVSQQEARFILVYIHTHSGISQLQSSKRHTSFTICWYTYPDVSRAYNHEHIRMTAHFQTCTESHTVTLPAHRHTHTHYSPWSHPEAEKPRRGRTTQRREKREHSKKRNHSEESRGKQKHRHQTSGEKDLRVKCEGNRRGLRCLRRQERSVNPDQCVFIKRVQLKWSSEEKSQRSHDFFITKL